MCGLTAPTVAREPKRPSYVSANERGEKHFLAIEDGVIESTQSWREVLLKLKSRGMNVPELAIELLSNLVFSQLNQAAA